jgi:hypothetical protein
LIGESDPQAKTKIETKICEFKAKIGECESDLLPYLQQNRADKSLALTMASITYDDINFVITALVNQRMLDLDDRENFQPTNPKEKMSKNDLTCNIKYLLEAGLAKAGEVRHFIENIAKINFPDVPEKIKNSLNAEYSRQIESGMRGDELFKHLHQFASNNNQDLSRQIAALAVLCYFFETCDVFEA